MTIIIDRPAPAPDAAPALEVESMLEIVVTPDDIAQGKRDSSSWCPFSLALRRAGHPSPSVGYLGIYLDTEQWFPFFGHTPESEAWVRAFDEGQAVAPERFVLHRRQNHERGQIITV